MPLPPTRTQGPEPPGRRCTHPGCITVLSTWHESPEQKCYTHESRRTIERPVGPGSARLDDQADDLQELIEA